jgi:hypothetical protein
VWQKIGGRMTELMKQYELATGKNMSRLMRIFENAENHSKEKLINVMVEFYVYGLDLEQRNDTLEEKCAELKEENKDLKKSLTWRPLSEEPTLKEMGKILCKNNDMKISVELWGIALEDWEDFVERLNIVSWLPIPSESY